MLDFRKMKNFVVLGGGTAGWFAALELRRMFGPAVSVTVIESPRVGVIGVGEGGILNFPEALIGRYGIDLDAFLEGTGAVFKLGFEYVGWNNGRDDDVFYHLFHRLPAEGEGRMIDGVAPYWSMLAAHGIGIHHAVYSLPFVLANASQSEVRKALEAAGGLMPWSLHFDAHRVAAWLKLAAMARGIETRVGNVVELLRDAESGHVRALRFEGEELPMPCDFLIDASGFARIALQKTMGSPLRSFTDYMSHDRAIPFYIPHPRPNPHLVTRSLAMSAGWIWQIPVRERVGCGYVYSSAYLSEDEALAEIESRLGQKIEPMPTLRFHAAHFPEVWVGNVMAVGLASGFIEPLEATSIGQMLGQLTMFGETVKQSCGVVPQSTISTFNHRNRLDWDGIRDFLCLHYDVPRRDTPFWRDVTSRAVPSTYSDLKKAWQLRTPRPVDFNAYRAGHVLHFDATSWFAVGQGVGVVPPAAAQADLDMLPREAVRSAEAFLHSVRIRNASARQS
ncbi:tryptophan 7-halogenase [Paraburkholderia dinghuensis]|uniref:Tryptophan 7-halogenase n=1 Tax=Paraburkholderia dinghuensis TaxID=2305225 RepID=A0A3N6Q990_9BURK|nr:tryptophan 7-halogenase [Paraburkholderia dinghuensis]RQH09146.1 tryptophan 7-halogenase [Paraburkholderia dinghuensis]